MLHTIITAAPQSERHEQLAAMVARYRDAFNAKGQADASGCHIWTAHRRAGGYGGFKMLPYNLAHQAAVILDGREIPAGMVVDHLCRNRLCVNPAHLRVVTRKVNAIENSVGHAAVNAAKTHCIHGHPLFGPNLVVRKRGHKTSRDCRICVKVRADRINAKLLKWREARDELRRRTLREDDLRLMAIKIADGFTPWGTGYYTHAEWRDAAENVLAAIDEPQHYPDGPDFAEMDWMDQREAAFEGYRGSDDGFEHWLDRNGFEHLSFPSLRRFTA